MSGRGALAIAAVLAIVLYAHVTPPIITDSDIALTELYTQLATHGRVFVGPYSRYGWNHPGPLYFYIQAPFYAAAGHRAASLYAVALAINLFAIATLAWCVLRKANWLASLFLTGACLVFAWRAPMLLASPWTGHIPILPTLAFVIVCAGIASGSTTWLPLAVCLGSFAVQTHVGFAPTVVVLLVSSVALVALRKHDHTSLRRSLHLSIWTATALWALPISTLR